MKKSILLLMAMLAGAGFTVKAQMTALYFDGKDDQLVISGTSKLNSLTKFTFETWIFCNSSNWSSSPCNNCAPIIWNQNSNTPYRFGVGNTKLLSLSINDGSTTSTCTSTKTLGTSVWQHIAASYDGSKIRLYIDGICTDSLSTTVTPNYKTKADIWVVDPQTGFGGILEETRMWDYARSQKEIAEGMKQTMPSTKSGLVLQLHYEDGVAYKNNQSVTTVKDYSTENNTVSIKNFLLKDTISNFVIGRGYCDTVAHGAFSVTRCKSYTLPSKKKVVTKSGTYYDTIISYLGCDSAMKINVTINPTSSSSVSITTCDSFIHPITKRVYFSGGKYVGTLPNWLGCDSLITYNVVLYRRDSSKLNYDACNAVQLNNGNWVYQSGIYVDTLSTWHGCDSFVFHHVNIRKTTYSAATLYLCNFVVCPSKKSRIFRSPGTYYDTITNKTGCDSVITYTVISAKSFSSFSVKSCGTYTCPSGKKITASGQYKDTLLGQNSKFCDSIITIDATIKNPSIVPLTISACKVYTVPSGKRSISVSNPDLTDTIRDSEKCDSVIYKINVTIVKPNSNFTRGTQFPDNHNTLMASNTNSGASFQWMECSPTPKPISGETKSSFTIQNNGSYALEVTENNCIDTSKCQSIAFNGMAKFDQDPINLFYNMASKMIEIRCQYEWGNCLISMYDLAGRNIFQEKISLNQTTEIPIDAPTGQYVLTILEQNGRFFSQLIQL